MVLSFRPADPSDVNRLLAMMSELYRGEGLSPAGGAAPALRMLLEDERLGRCIVIERDGGMIGYFVLGFGFSLEFGGRDAFLDELYVVPEARGAGVGKAAVRHAAELCAKSGIGALHLEVSRANLRAQRLYRGAGFQERHAGYDTLTLRIPPGT